MKNRYSLTIIEKNEHDVLFDVEYYINNLPSSAIEFAKFLINKYNNITNEIWLFDNSLCCNVARIYRNKDDNNTYVKCYATL